MPTLFFSDASKLHKRNLNKQMTQTYKKHLTLIGAAFFIAAAASNGAIIFQDDFSGLAADNLNGTTPDMTTGGTNWRANPGFKANGTNNDAGDGGAYLDFVPSAGKVYTLSATMTSVDVNNNNWLAFGFVQSTLTLTGGQSRHSNPDSPGGIAGANGIAWLLHRDVTTEDNIQAFGGPNTSRRLYNTNANNTSTISVVTTLDATSASNVLWSLSIDGSTVITAADLGSLSALNINGVGFSHDSGGNASFDNFELSSVPEPSAALLGAIGALALLRRRR